MQIFIFICYLASILKVASVGEFLIEESYLLALACGDSSFIESLRVSSKTEMCDQRQYYDDLKCIKLHIENDEASYTLELYRNESELVGRYRCRYLYGSASDSAQYLFRMSGTGHFKFHISEASNFIELFLDRHSNNSKRRLQGTCSADIKFNTVTYK
jgi:hypothetical protein